MRTARFLTSDLGLLVRAVEPCFSLETCKFLSSESELAEGKELVTGDFLKVLDMTEVLEPLRLSPGLAMAESLEPKECESSFLSAELAMVNFCVFKVVGGMLFTLGGSRASCSMPLITHLVMLCLKVLS